MSKSLSFFKHSIVIKKSKAVVFNALSKADELIRWFPSRAESDPKSGGKIKLFFDFTDASQNGVQEGEYVEVVPTEKLSYTWLVADGSVLTRVTFFLKESSGETTIDLEHSTAQADADEKKLHDGHANQWGFFQISL